MMESGQSDLMNTWDLVNCLKDYNLKDADCLRALFLVCQSVREMVVKDCWGLKDGIFLNANLCRRVKLLWIEGCSRLTTEGVEAVVLDLKELESFNTNYRRNSEPPKKYTKFTKLSMLLKMLSLLLPAV
ncbi:hypothetical protein LXL04_024728 [Taraxacum kok-saghyz]